MTGLNTIEFQVTQEAGGGFGLDYSGYVTDPVGQVSAPEPSPVASLALGLVALAAFATRRKHVRVL
jgi:hypothetical protein